jgi:hypothetical protein
MLDNIENPVVRGGLIGTGLFTAIAGTIAIGAVTGGVLGVCIALGLIAFGGGGAVVACAIQYGW